MNEEVLNQLILLNKEGFDLMLRRYELLRSISYIQPVGRRQLAVYTGCTEREVRSDADELKLAGLIKVENSGMIVSRNGYKLLQGLEGIMLNVESKDELALELKDKYKLKSVDIVNGDADSHMLVRRNIGLRAAMRIRKYMQEYKTFALSGHEFVGMMVDGQFPPGVGKGISIFPARTAQLNSEDVNANTYCSRLGKKSGATYKLLHLGDNPSINELERRYRETDVVSLVSSVENADVLVSGLTSLKKSHLLNSMSVRAKDLLMQSDPCCELMGNFIKPDGRQINNPPLYSLSMDQISKYEIFMLLAAGHDETDGILAIANRFKNIHLITDARTAGRLISHN